MIKNVWNTDLIQSRLTCVILKSLEGWAMCLRRRCYSVAKLELESE